MSPELRQKLDRVTNILFAGGVSNPITYIEQLSYLIYLKMLDEEENEREREQRMLGDKLGTDSKGDIYEYLLSYTQGQETLGQFRTPRQVRRMMVSLVDPDFGDSICDPCCGTGGFLIDAVEHILARYSAEPVEVPIYGEGWLERRGFDSLAAARKKFPRLQTYAKGAGEKLPDWSTLERAVYGIDVSRQLMRIAMMNLVLHGFRNANIKRGNTISEAGGLTEDDLNRRYKVILSNPPFAGMIPRESIRTDLPTQSKKSELLFLGVMMKALAPGGRCAVVVPEGLLFGSTGAHVDIRKKLLEDYEVLAVVSLPAGVFKPYAGVKTSVLVFRQPAAETKPAPAQRKVWFYEVTNDGYDPDKISGGGRVETPGENRIPDLLKQWETYRKSRFQSPPGPAAGETLDAKADPPRCWWAGHDLIAESDYNLSAGRYKPHRASQVVDEDPEELIKETLRIEKSIVKDLESLLTEIH